MKKYDPRAIESNWKDKWFEDNIYAAEDFSSKPKQYILAELPYPSGKSLHVGHVMRYTVPEIYSRYLRMKGFNVMFPMGWDAFGLPTEGYALKENKSPQEVTDELTKSYKKAIQDMGYAVDWNREFSTTDPKYYKWTQWLFLKFYEHGLAELKEMPVWWCEELGNLADEEILTDKEGNKISERGGHKVERKLFRQWVLKIPEYAEKLLEGLNKTDFPDYVKNAQVNWIGKSQGALIDFYINGSKLDVFSTRPDTIFGVTFIALAPEHPIIEKLYNNISNADEVSEYVQTAKNLSAMDRKTLKEKTGVLLQGITAKHPFEEFQHEIPVFVTDYVLMDYGTGCIMGVPGHDERDNEFAQKYSLKIIEVIKQEKEFEGIMINSFNYNGMSSENFKEAVIERLEKSNLGKRATTYKMRDWVFSRQHYWGEPIPIVYKEDGTVEAIVETENMDQVHKLLPLELPESKDYKSKKDGSAPLSKLENWVNTLDRNGNPAKRETQTMPTWAGSSWYYLRYIDPSNDGYFADYEKLKYWLPVDKYFGGAEHTTVHLLYSRFWHKFFYDIGLVPTEEPYNWRMNGGLLLAEDGRKMSKRLGNVLEPKLIMEKYGADAMKMAISFLGPYRETYPWNEGAIKSTSKLLKTIFSLREVISEDTPVDQKLATMYHRMIKNITNMIEDLKMNTAVSEFMIFINELKTRESISKDMWKGFIKVLAPFAPFLAEELWYEVNGYTEWKKENSVHLQDWPKYDEALAKESTITVPVQINGKLRGEIKISKGESEDSVKNKVFSEPSVLKHLEGRAVKNFIYVTDRIVSLVI